MSAVDVIDGAIEAITGNWCQNSLYTQEGQVCARGALMIGAGFNLQPYGPGSNYIEMIASDGLDMNSYHRACEALESVINCNVPTWNDSVAQSEEDIILALKQAKENLLDE